MTVVVTGLGAVTCFGAGVDALWDGLLRADRLPVPAPDACGLPEPPPLYAADPDPSAPGFPPTHGEGAGRTGALLLSAVAEAVAEAGLTDEDLLDAGLTVGTSLGDIDLAEGPAAPGRPPATHRVAAVVAGRFGIGGPGHTLSTACSAGTYAVGWAAELIETGQADVVIACGGDAFSRVAVGTLHRFGLLDPLCCRPFDTGRAGMVTGEGAAAVVLESAASARRRGVSAQAVLAGQGWSCDAHHPMAPEPSGEQLGRAVAGALATTSGPPGAVVLHRAGVALNDSVESIAVSGAVTAAGGDAAEVAGYAPKAVMGHTAGAAGVFGCVIAARILRHGLVPPNAHVESVDPACPMAVPLGGPVPLSRPSVLVSGTGFGGNNAVLAWEATG
ncbi:beta-ketoacyl-[acyl-carrier-protein] synthase family protein [Streptomyces sp. NBC_01237]|uniref:beta-ketoacyl-[acyl-carrier-protein] synthase family protein n=1 Tax=Streptomyces sp. NBC_01237 TaxID=2903790 RepID=UPI002DD9CC7B|nr:beta-ketoacyl synthase N-terminal-like domain-containing protein [Streptomyces sp. NBC_01237]WRZ73409.1 beta-ketoacyl-[acyl-carrier-protein] synthase family protein [Streptomyces sp. NBC_01237]